MRASGESHDNLGDLIFTGSQADLGEASCHAVWKQAGGRGSRMDFQVWVAGDNRG